MRNLLPLVAISLVGAMVNYTREHWAHATFALLEVLFAGVCVAVTWGKEDTEAAGRADREAQARARRVAQVEATARSGGTEHG